MFTTPVIANLKRAWPEVLIGYVCNRRTAPLLERNPKVNKVFIYERDEFEQVSRHSKIEYLRKVKDFLGAIKKEKFDTAIDFSLNSSVSFLTYAAGIKERLGFNYKNRSRFLTDKIPLEGYEDKHVVDYYLDLLEYLGIKPEERRLEITPGKEDLAWAKEVFLKHNLQKEKSVIGLVPGGGASWGRDAVFKRWGAGNYAKLADKIVEKLSAPIILMGDESEVELCKKIQALMAKEAVSLCGKTTLHQFACVASLCSLMVVNDGGPLHLAVASGVKTASIFGPVDEKVYGPYPLDNHVVITQGLPCRPCYRRFRKASCEHISCLMDISVEDVFKKVEGCL